MSRTRSVVEDSKNSLQINTKQGTNIRNHKDYMPMSKQAKD